MQKPLFKVLAPALIMGSAMVSELPASTFGGSTGPRQAMDDLPRVEVDINTYRRTKARLSVEEIAPLSLPSGAYMMRKSDELIIEFNQSFQLVTTPQ